MTTWKMREANFKGPGSYKIEFAERSIEVIVDSAGTFEADLESGIPIGVWANPVRPKPKER